MNDSKPISQPHTASTWRPSKEVEIIVGTPPGGGQDRPARALMKVMESAGIVTVPMKLSNVVGKGGGAAWDALRARGGDPHVLSINSGPLLSNRMLGVADYDHAAPRRTRAGVADRGDRVAARQSGCVFFRQATADAGGDEGSIGLGQ